MGGGNLATLNAFDELGRNDGPTLPSAIQVVTPFTTPPDVSGLPRTA